MLGPVGRRQVSMANELTSLCARLQLPDEAHVQVWQPGA